MSESDLSTTPTPAKKGHNGHASGPSHSSDLIVRVGTFYLSIDKETDLEALLEETCRELSNDNRVTEVKRPEHLPDWDRAEDFFPVNQTDGMKVLKGSDRSIFARFVNPIEFRVRVPTKNQPMFRGNDDIPTEAYSVLWDGQALLVGWEQSHDRAIPQSGGHIIETILKEAAVRAGADLSLQPCSPGCDFMFFHTTIKVIPNVNATEAEFLRDEKFRNVVVIQPPPSVEPGKWLRDLYGLIVTTSGHFARMKNTSARIQALESEARFILGEILAMAAQWEHVKTHSLFTTLPRRWQLRGSHQRTKEQLTHLWYAVTSLEMLKRQWAEERIRFMEEAEEVEGLDRLFVRDDSPEAQTVESLNLGTIQAAVNHLSGTFETRSVVFATVLGALAGAIAGGIISVL